MGTSALGATDPGPTPAACVNDIRRMTSRKAPRINSGSTRGQYGHSAGATARKSSEIEQQRPPLDQIRGNVCWAERRIERRGSVLIGDVTQPSRVAVLASLIQGHGVFATHVLPCGTVVLRLDDSRVVDANHPLRPDAGELERHRDFLPDGTAVLMQSPERYINHSCDPNCFVYSANHERFVLAKRDLAAGEEILIDYAFNAVDGDEWECRCGAPNCRGLHKCDFFCLPLEIQRENLPWLDPWFAAVHAARIQRLLAVSMVRRAEADNS